LASQFLTKSISETKEELLNKLNSLLENGATALGPSVLISVAMAGKIKEGSTVVVCTDGLAN
jgi:hypothetical protein